MKDNNLKKTIIKWIKTQGSLNYYEDIFDKNDTNLNKINSLIKNFCLYDLGSSGITPKPFCWVHELTNIINFEPDPRAKSDILGDTLPIAIGPKKLNTIFLNKRQTTSSLLKPNMKILNRYDFTKILDKDPDIFETIGSQKVQTFGLDEIIKSKNLPSPDFIKIDVQGLTHEVIESSQNCLRESVVGLQIEHELIECYEGQKTFGVTHEYLHNLGFEFFKLINHSRWQYKTNRRLKYYSGQEIFFDFIYFRSIDSILENKQIWNEDKGIKTILILLLYNFTDPAAAYLEKMDSEDLISKETYQQLHDLITNWESVVNFIYKTDIPHKFLSYIKLVLNIASHKFLNLKNTAQ